MKNAKGKAFPGKTEIAGIKLTHPDKILYAGQNVTKLALAEYYEAIAPWILPHVAGRPISLVRCPEGAAKTCFFQRHVSQGLSPHIKPVPVTINEERDYLMIEDVRGLIALVQMGVLEIHIWGAHADTIAQPDRLVFDLDPSEGVAWKIVKDTARKVRDRLKKAGLESFLLATGGKGLHVVVPLKPAAGWPEVKDFAHRLARQMAHDEPKLYTASPRKIDRGGRIFIDYLRNTKGASAIAPYSTRAREGAPVAVPLEWRELAKLENAHAFSMQDVLRRMQKRKADPWNMNRETKQMLKV